jgi:hypothetical protein
MVSIADTVNGISRYMLEQIGGGSAGGEDLVEGR